MMGRKASDLDWRRGEKGYLMVPLNGGTDSCARLLAMDCLWEDHRSQLVVCVLLCVCVDSYGCVVRSN